MTSDAKIGLLLGLVFIFIIAFIINGLPNLRPQTTRAQVTTDGPAFTEENMGIAEKEQKAQEVLNWEELLEQQGGVLAEFDEAAAEPGLTGGDSDPVTQAPPTPVAVADSEDVRAVLPLPSAETVEKLTQGLGNILKDLTETSRPALAQEETTEPAPVVATPEPKPTTRRQARQITEALRKPPARVAARPKVYVVTEGDNLASVARNVYGPEEGNKRANIERIFQANRRVLDSPDEIYVGQKLIIPPLPRSAPPKNTVDSALPDGMFEKVESIGREQLAGIGRKETKERYYVVQDGDNLWKIASSQLGSGARYEEIAKLNADILKGKEVLDIGVRLRLPSK